MTNEEKILEMLTEMRSDIGQINGRLDNMDGRLDNMDGRLDNMGGRLDRLEATQAEMQKTLTRVAVTQENIVLPRLDTLADGHAHLVKTLATKAQVEDLAGEVGVIKEVVSRHSGDINKLKKAQ